MSLRTCFGFASKGKGMPGGMMGDSIEESLEFVWITRMCNLCHFDTVLVLVSNMGAECRSRRPTFFGV